MKKDNGGQPVPKMAEAACAGDYLNITEKRVRWTPGADKADVEGYVRS